MLLQKYKYIKKYIYIYYLFIYLLLVVFFSLVTEAAGYLLLMINYEYFIFII